VSRGADQDVRAAALVAWRHPLARGAHGRCIGHADLPVDPRRAKRLAHRIRAQARRWGLPRHVVTSPLQRSAAVGRWLARWGWRHRIDPALSEVDFGAWDGRRWADIPRGAVDAWCADFVHHAPGGGESVATLLERVGGFDPGAARVVVTHGGWLSAAAWLQSSGAAPAACASWPGAPRHGSCTLLPRWPLDIG
jgi:alpha-ribazole phosphatase